MYWTLKPRSHRRTCRSLPEWEKHPEERPGENLRIEENTLLYERDGFEVAIESYKTTHWRVDLSIPSRSASGTHGRSISRLSVPEYGFVDSVETSDSYAAIGATLIIQRTSSRRLRSERSSTSPRQR